MNKMIAIILQSFLICQFRRIIELKALIISATTHDYDGGNMDNTDAGNRAKLNAFEPGKNIEDKEILVKSAKTISEVNHD